MGAPLTCPAGFTVSTDRTACNACPAGSECTTVVNSSQAACAAPTFSLGHQNACTSCATDLGAVCSGSTFSVCAVGTYQTSNTCTACPDGKECLDRETAVDCATGETRPAADLACFPCKYDSQCPTKSSETACPSGEYPSATPTACTACAAGSQCPDLLRAPFACPLGFYATGSATACNICPAGSACSVSTAPSTCPANQHSLAGYYDCASCPYGSSCSSAQELPAPCAAGQYWDGSTCATCEVGFECPSGLERNTLPQGFGTSATGQVSHNIVYALPLSPSSRTGNYISSNAVVSLDFFATGDYSPDFLNSRPPL